MLATMFRWLLLTTLVLGVFITGNAPAPAAPQAVMVSLVSPSACPGSGCAAGQRLNMRSDYDLSAYDPAAAFNVQVCLYTPINWSANSLITSPVGGVTNAVYTPSITYCQPAPTDYTLLGGAVASLTGTHFGDSLGLAFRIGNTALTSGSVLVRVYERAPGDTWVTQQAFLAVPVIPVTSAVFVANDAATCSINSPCYVNSGDDLANGIGTGLKDAIDAQITPGTIDILGSYLLKSSAVLVNKAVTIRGVNDAILISGGVSCSEPLLRIVQGASIRDLNFQGGSPCGTTRRDLIEVDSAADVTIQQNDFINGDDAVHILDNTGNVTVQFNHIENNSGYALFREAGTGTGLLNAVANNFFSNRVGPDVECNSKGQVDHNFWGTSLVPSVASNQCNPVDGKRLGAAAQRRQTGAGVEAQRLTVNSTKQYFFNNQIALQLAPEGSSVDMYVVSHGASGAFSVPFTGGSPDDMTPCSNYWDVFLANGAVLPDALTLALKYDQNPGCIASIESSSYCAQSDMARYPLWWYDPATNVTRGWDKTGQNPEGSGAGGVSGQVTTCNQAENEIQVVMDTDGRPNLSNDLFFTPFVVGLPSTSSGVVITRFVGLPGDQQATIQWTTTSEVNVLGFYVQRSDQPDTGFASVSDYIAGLGSAGSGADYEFVNTGLTNGTTYYYRLQVVNMDLSNTYTGSIAVTSQPATPTPTVTVTPTTTNTVTATLTVTPLISGTPTITPTVTTTVTVTGTPPTATPTRTATRTPTPTKTLVIIKTRTRTLIPTYTRRVVSPTSVNRTRTPTPMSKSATPIPGKTINPTIPYPVVGGVTPTTLGVIPTQAYGYPDVNTPTASLEVAEVSAVPRGTSVALTAAARPRLTSTVVSSEDEQKRPGWVVPLVILLIGLLAMLAVAVYLWLEGVITLPFPVPAAWKKWKSPTAASLEAEDEDHNPTDPPVDDGMA